MDKSNYSVKLHVNDEVRRFVFSGTSYAALKDKCTSLANITEGNKFDLKYDDAEGDRVSISTDQELDYALSITTSGILRLRLEKGEEPTNVNQPGEYTHFDPTHGNWRARKDAHKMAKREMKYQMKAQYHNPPAFTPGAHVYDPSGPYRSFGFPPHHHHHHHPYPPPSHPPPSHPPPFSHHPHPPPSHPPPFFIPPGGNPYVPPHGYSPIPTPNPNPLASSDPYGKKIKELDARFIMHQSYPDDSEIPAGIEFEKTWRFRNNGLLKWPNGTVFLRVDRGNELSAADTTPVTSIEPNEETDVTVKMVSPMAGGRYQSYFKLCTSTGKKFGQRMRCQILSVSTSISPERIDKVWEQLEAMGFVLKGERPNNVSALILKENCDVTKIVRELLRNK